MLKNKKNRSLKFGLIFGIIGIILLIIYNPLIYPFTLGDSLTTSTFNILILIIYFPIFIALIVFNAAEYTAFIEIIIYLITFIIYFLLGALIGWLYGKIKNKNP